MALQRTLPTASLDDWNRRKPTLIDAAEAMERAIKCAPAGWREAMQARFAAPARPVFGEALTDPPEWAQAWDLMQVLGDFQDDFGSASQWNLDDGAICEMARKLAGEASELDALTQGAGGTLADRVDAIRMLVRAVGVVETKPIAGLPAIKRAQDDAWWRKRLRVHVARVVEAGAISLGLVHKGAGGYISRDGLQRRQAQLARNAAALNKSLVRNEAGQVWRLAELAALGTANPVIRGGELMTRIRGAEEYADQRAHVGLFLTLTLPSRFHPMTLGSGGRPRANPKFQPGLTPRDGQLWLRAMWAKTRAALARAGVRMYGLRVAEPHHDGTPHWHALLWAENEASAQLIEAKVRHYWLSDDGGERGAAANRINIKRMVKGGAAGYVAKYIAKSVGHLALAQHQDLVDGQQVTMDFGPTEPENLREPETPNEGHRRVDAWASTWGIRQFQAVGMPSVTVWRELRRVTPDQIEMFQREGDWTTWSAYQACHRVGESLASWCSFMRHMGGHARKRGEWHLVVARNMVEPGAVNTYGEEVKVGRTVGLCAQRGRMRGRWLVSRRMRWARVGQEDLTPEQAAQADAQAGAKRPALPAAWTGFNNCTARLDGALLRTVQGYRNPENPPPPPFDSLPGEDRWAQFRALAAEHACP